ncbi:MAG TPA: phospholipid carrier-dependent glycosyltransferase [Thermoanaerobaculia bacterium]
MPDRRTGAAVLSGIILVVVALSIASVWLDSATSDEPSYIAAGTIKLMSGRLDYFRDEPPLWISVSAAPLAIAGYRLPPIWNANSDHWSIGKRFLWRSGFDGHRMLFLARLPTIALFAALIVAMYAFVLHETKSVACALIAAVLTGFCPSLMAHGRLATVDLALSFFTFVAAALFLLMIESGSAAAAIGCGVASAAAIMSKTSGNILGPYFLILLIAALAMRADRRRLVAMFAVAVLSAIAFAELFILAEARSFNVLLPFREYVENIRAISGWYTHGHVLPQFLLGRFSTSGFYAYYEIAFLLKTTVAALALIFAALLRVLARFRFSVPGARFAWFALLGFPVLFLIIAAFGHLTLGIRYVLPIYPFLYAATAIGFQPRTGDRAGRTPSAAGTLLAAVLVWHAAENLMAFPNYISYFNEFISSPRRADEYLIDSNLDWGQDLRRLDAWCRDNHVAQITVHYFGGADVAYDVRSARPVLLRGPGFGPLPKGYFALSRHLYRVSFAPGVWPMNYDRYLAANHAHYVTTVGGSINVYRVE